MESNIKMQTRILWEKCFSEEDKRFVELYFERRYNDDNNIYIEKDGKVISAMQLISYPFSYYGKSIGCSYFSACCTDPEYRSQGIMSELLIKSLYKAKKNGACFASLIPASEGLFNFYSGTNFVPTFDYSKIHVNINKNNINIEQHSVSISAFKLKSENPELFYEVYEYLNSKMRNRNCCIQHSEYDFRVIVEDIELFGNQLLVAKYGENICGLAFCYIRNKEIYIKDIFAESSAIFSDLITAASNYFSNSSVNIIIPPVAWQKTHRLGMARIIDAETMLRIYAMSHNKMNTEISLVDPIIAENNGTYYISNGNLDKKNSIGTDIVDIEQLTQALFGYHTETLPKKLRAFNNQAAFMSLMMD